MKAVAGAIALRHLASAVGFEDYEESSIVVELKAGSEDAYSWLITNYHHTIYSLVARIVQDPADASDTVQEVFLKVYRGIKSFNGESSLKTWIYRIALHEASNRRRWWFRHKSKDVTIESPSENEDRPGIKESLQDPAQSPFDDFAHSEVCAKVEAELAEIAEPYRTTVVLRDIEGLSYEEIVEITQVSLGTVKSRLTRGRMALKKRLEVYVREHGEELGLRNDGTKPVKSQASAKARATAGSLHAIEVSQ